MSHTQTQRLTELDKTALTNDAALPGCRYPSMTNLKETIMNAKQLFAAATLAVIGASAFAAEGTQFVPQTGTLTRAEVRAELARAQAAGELPVVSATYGNFAPVARAVYKAEPTQASRSRDDVRAEARAAVRDNSVSTLYVGG
jgi:hypothetical protein